MPPVSRRQFLVRGAAVAGLAAAGTALAPEAADAAVTTDLAGLRARARAALATGVDPTIRPTGPDYIRYEDLYRSGDSVGGALARLTQPKIVTFPEGRFSCSDFNSGFLAGIAIPSICRGIVGSGPGTLGGSRGTVFTMAPWSSRKGNGARDGNGQLYVPVQGSSTPCQLNVLKQVGQWAPAVWKNFQIAGTPQGHIFSAFQVHGTAGANVFEDLLINGWEGNAGSPPGETSALAVSGVGGHSVTRVEVDGRRTPGGEIVGAMGLTFQNSAGAAFHECYVHDLRCASYVMFQSVNGQMVNCTSDATASSDKAIGNGGINLERTSGWTLVNPTIIGRSRHIHISHSTDSWVYNQAGVYVSTRNGSLKVVNPTYNDLWGNGYLYIQSWNPYWNGDSLTTPPLVTKSDWATHLPYNWVHNGSRVIY